jgi:membrane protein
MSKRAIHELTLKEKLSLIKETFTSFFEMKVFYHGATLAYYSLFALIPLLYLVITVVGKMVGTKAIVLAIKDYLENHIGLNDAELLFGFLFKIDFEKSNIYLELIGIIALLISITAIFTTLKTSLNIFFRVKYKPKNLSHGILQNVLFRLSSIVFLGFVSLFFIGFYFLQVVVLSFGEKFLSDYAKLHGFFQIFVEHLFSVLILWVIFIVIFKYAHDGIVAFKTALFGSLVTAILMYVGQLVIKFYLVHHFFASNAGLAGGIMILLVWLFYCSQILYFGAHLIYMYAKATHNPIKPKG